MLIDGTDERGKEHRKFLLEFCDSIIAIGKQKKESDKAPCFSEIVKNHILDRFSDFAAKSLIKDFFDQNQPIDLAKATARLLKALNRTASLFNFFPKKDREWLLGTFEALKDKTLSEVDTHALMKKIHNFRVQFCEILKIAARYQKTTQFASFFQYLIHRTNEIHKNDSSTAAEEPQIVDAYDPRKGVSYNFTSHGGQIRKLPKYSMEGKYFT